MNKNSIQQIVGVFVMTMFMIACSNEDENKNNIPDPKGDTNIEIDTKAKLDAGLHCDMYLFKKNNGENDNKYKLDKIQTFGDEDIAIVEFPNADLMACEYRLFFIAVPPADKAEINVKSAASNALIAKGDLWTDLRFEAAKEELSDKFYYGMVDKTGMQIFNDGKVICDLSRLIGRQDIQLYKAIDGDYTKPTSISADAASVLDRVYKIEVEYTGMTKTMAFKGTKLDKIEEVAQFPTYKQTYQPVINETAGIDLLKVNIPQKDKTGKQLYTVGTHKGSLWMKGPNSMPAKEKIRIKATFHYYHTTPAACKAADPTAHAHTKECFETKTLTLNLPATAATPLLTTFSDMITYNKGGIRYDRIIDIGSNGSVSFNTEWD